MAQQVTSLLAMQQMQVWSLDQEDPLEKEMVIHAIILAWKIPWTAEPGWLQSMGSQSQIQLSTRHSTCIFILKNKTLNKCYIYKQTITIQCNKCYNRQVCLVPYSIWDRKDPTEDIASTVSTNSVWPGTVQLRELVPESNLHTLPSLRNSCCKKKKVSWPRQCVVWWHVYFAWISIVLCAHVSFHDCWSRVDGLVSLQTALWASLL